MGSRTHVLGAVAASIAVSQLLGFDLAHTAVVVGTAVAGGKAPDLDRHIDDGPDHRSITHSVVFGGGGVVVLAAVVFAAAHISATPYLGAGAIGVAAGYLSHLLLDSLTPARVFVAGSGGRRIGPGLIKTGGLGEMGVMATLAVGVAALAINGGYV